MSVWDFTLPTAPRFPDVLFLFRSLQQHGAGQRLPDPFQSCIPVPVHPVQFQNHLPLLALPDGCCQVSTLQRTAPNFTVERVYGTIVKGVTFPGNT